MFIFQLKTKAFCQQISKKADPVETGSRHRAATYSHNQLAQKLVQSNKFSWKNFCVQANLFSNTLIFKGKFFAAPMGNL